MRKLIMAVLLFTTPAQAQLFGQKPMGWDRPNTSQQVFMADRFSCIQASQQRRYNSDASINGQIGQGFANSSSYVIVSSSMFSSCMGALGYVPSENGRMRAPQSAGIRMQ